MHFCVVYVYYFSSGSKVIKGVKRSNSFFNGPKKIKYFKSQNTSSNVLGMTREEKVSTVTPSSDLPLWGSKVKKGPNFKVFQMAKITVSMCGTWIENVFYHV